MIVVGDREALTRQLGHQVLGGFGILIAVSGQLNPGPDQQRTEDHKGEGEVRERGRTNGNKDGAEHQRQDDPEQQHPLLQGVRNQELSEDDGEDEQVVDRQALLHQVRGKELGASGRALPPEDDDAEHHRHRDVKHRPPGRLSDSDVVWLVAYRKIEREQPEDHNYGGDPDPDAHVESPSSLRLSNSCSP